jgi:diguanylate cyclase (GGDEF)-like protein
MTTQPTPAAPDTTELPKSLSKLLQQSEHIEELVKQSAEELATVNATLKKEIATHEPSTVVERALDRSEAIEAKVEDASEKLTAVNQALEGEVRDRHLLDHELVRVKKQEEAARHASFHDVLTGLPNRALFNDRLQHGLAQAKRQGWTLAVMFLDLDKFKSINDQHGHDVGDTVLKEVARRLKDSTRGDDTISRLGGDEFICFLTDVREVGTVARIAVKIIDALQAPLDIQLRGLSVSLTIRASIGIAMFPNDGETVDTLVVSADLAMYRAKKCASGYAFAD